jgi:hypothetical protein
MNDISTHDYVESSGNVFADMELEEADELLTRAFHFGCTTGVISLHQTSALMTGEETERESE